MGTSLPMVFEAASVSGASTDSRSGSRPCEARKASPSCDRPVLAKAAVTPNKAGEEQQKLPVDGADHGVRRQPPRHEQQAGNGECGKLARQWRWEKADKDNDRRPALSPSGNGRSEAPARRLPPFRLQGASRQVARIATQGNGEAGNCRRQRQRQIGPEIEPAGTGRSGCSADCRSASPPSRHWQRLQGRSGMAWHRASATSGLRATSGVSAKTTTSLVKTAASAPVTAIRTASSVLGCGLPERCDAPPSRRSRNARTGRTGSSARKSRAMVGMSTAAPASSSVRSPKASSTISPSSATPVRSMARRGTRPSAIPVQDEHENSDGKRGSWDGEDSPEPLR